MSKELIEIAFYSLNEANLVATAVRAASKSALRVNVFMDSRTAPEELLNRPGFLGVGLVELRW
jgi:hypothetical protein